MKRGARFGAGGQSRRREVQLRGGRSRVTPRALAPERPLARSSSLRCTSELWLLMRGKYRSGGARPPHARPSAPSACGFTERLELDPGATWARPPGGTRGVWGAATLAS